MAFDGLTIRALKNELDKKITGGIIRKIIQPEEHELLITVKSQSRTERLLISANASLPLIYLIPDNRQAPISAPNFCMLLRKHINGGRIVSIEQPSNERVLVFVIEHRNEMGDFAKKYLYCEMMGRHSNIIFVDESNKKIIDGIKHVSFSTSSVREILPGREYFIPLQEGKKNPYNTDRDSFISGIKNAHKKISAAITSDYIGISKVSANEMAYRAQIDADASTDSLSDDQIHALCDAFFLLLKAVDDTAENCCIVYEDDTKHIPIEFAPFNLSIYEDKTIVNYPDISDVLVTYYDNKNRHQNIRQKSSDLRKLVSTLLERNEKKLALQQKQMQDTDKMEHLRLCGTLLQIYPNDVPPKASEVILTDYETDKPVKIRLDPDKNAIDNASAYFKKYSKLKRTKEALEGLLAETNMAVEHLSSIQNSLMIAQSAADLEDIRRELAESGYIRKRSSKKAKRQEKSRPIHYVTEDGFHIYVGKNNYQNDELTFKLASSDDWWFHAKKIPGSHVVITTQGRTLPDELFVACAQIAGYYSQGRESDKLEIDYVKKKEVKKPSGAVPGFVVYYTNYSMTIHPVLPEGITLVD